MRHAMHLGVEHTYDRRRANYEDDRFLENPGLQITQ